MEKDRYHDYGSVHIKAEGQSVEYDTPSRTPEEVIEYLKEQLRQARLDQNRYRRVRRLATNQKLMVANREGFVLVEDLDEYLQGEIIGASPLTRKDIINEALSQMEDAFRQGYKAAP